MLTSTALTLLDISIDSARDSTLLRKAYHAALLRSHPDKVVHPHQHVSGAGPDTVDDVRAAYLHLLSSLYEVTGHEKTGYAILDLDDFTYAEQSATWFHACRCGHGFSITESDLEQGRDVVGCDGCSLFVRVTYEEATTDDEHGAS